MSRKLNTRALRQKTSYFHQWRFINRLTVISLVCYSIFFLSSCADNSLYLDLVKCQGDTSTVITLNDFTEYIDNNEINIRKCSPVLEHWSKKNSLVKQVLLGKTSFSKEYMNLKSRSLSTTGGRYDDLKQVLGNINIGDNTITDSIRNNSIKSILFWLLAVIIILMATTVGGVKYFITALIICFVVFASLVSIDYNTNKLNSNNTLELAGIMDKYIQTFLKQNKINVKGNENKTTVTPLTTSDDNIKDSYHNTISNEKDWSEQILSLHKSTYFQIAIIVILAVISLFYIIIFLKRQILIRKIKRAIRKENLSKHNETIFFHLPFDFGKRNIRVFISSTFKDMQEEREYLIKYIFPKIRNTCMSRGIGLSEVDLRWGITREQAERGEVIPICLDEIDRCRPYFIGIIGGRYGWVPESFSQKLLDKYPWISEYRDRSVTELEIVHAVLRPKDTEVNAFFYFNKKFSSPDRFMDKREFEQIQNLKNRIKKKGFPVSGDYQNIETLGKLVEKDLMDFINQKFPSQPLTPLEQERFEHEAFAHFLNKIYIGNRGIFNLMDSHDRRTGLVVLGESGSGKSALLANWAVQFRKKYPDAFMVTHFTGCSASSADHIRMLQRIMLEIKSRYDFSEDIPDKPEEVRGKFANWLYKATARGRFVLVIDALNQITDNSGTDGQDLYWLPKTLPTSMTLITSTLPGRCLDELQSRKWPTIKVKPFQYQERQEFITRYLKKFYSKELSSELVSHIALHDKCENPLFLRTLLEELRIFGKHEEIHEKINYYLQAINTKELFELILTRLEVDYEKEFPGLVKEVMALLWTSRQGLTEHELVGITSMTCLAISPLLGAIRESLINRTGLLYFSHEFFKQAVYDKYIETPAQEKVFRVRIIDYFKNRDTDIRKIEELPWQLSLMESWDDLVTLLSNFEFFPIAWQQQPYEIRRYWSDIESHSQFRSYEIFKPVLENPSDLPNTSLDCTATLLCKLGYHMKTKDIWDVMLKRESDKTLMLKFLGFLGKIFESEGDLHEALRLYTKKEKLAMGEKNYKEYINALNNQGLVLESMGKYGNALKILDLMEQWAKALRYDEGLQYCYGTQASVFRHKNPKKTMRLLRKKADICKTNGFIDSYSSALNNIAILEDKMGKKENALKIFHKVETLSRELGAKSGLQMCLGNMACIYTEIGDDVKALLLHKEEEEICREMKNKNGLQMCLGNQALIYFKNNNPEYALHLLKEQEEICMEIKSDSLHWCRNLKSQIMQKYH